MPATHAETLAALAPACCLTTLAALTHLAAMNHSRPGIIVPPDFFKFRPSDADWLRERGLIKKVGRTGHMITPLGIAQTQALKQHLAEITTRP